jgi:hypothetical protein
MRCPNDTDQAQIFRLCCSEDLNFELSLPLRGDGLFANIVFFTIRSGNTSLLQVVLDVLQYRTAAGNFSLFLEQVLAVREPRTDFNVFHATVECAQINMLMLLLQPCLQFSNLALHGPAILQVLEAQTRWGLQAWQVPLFPALANDNNNLNVDRYVSRHARCADIMLESIEQVRATVEMQRQKRESQFQSSLEQCRRLCESWAFN